MRRLAHLSDLHFGRTDARVVEALQAALLRARPDLLVISGDLTQRARRTEFEQARAFLDSLPFPRLVVPGNHDIPLYSVVERCLRPLDRYCRYITEDRAPFYGDDELAIAGLDTTRIVTKNGRIQRQEVARACERLIAAAPRGTRVIVTHHPFDLPPAFASSYLVKNASSAMKLFASCRVDLFLSGHLHTAHWNEAAERYDLGGHAALVVHAGTAVSTRLRRQPNSWNLIEIERPRLAVVRFSYDNGTAVFVPTADDRFLLGDAGWQRVSKMKERAS